jgi:hypothetical protein
LRLQNATGSLCDIVDLHGGTYEQVQHFVALNAPKVQSPADSTHSSVETTVVIWINLLNLDPMTFTEQDNYRQILVQRPNRSSTNDIMWEAHLSWAVCSHLSYATEGSLENFYSQLRKLSDLVIVNNFADVWIGTVSSLGLISQSSGYESTAISTQSSAMISFVAPTVPYTDTVTFIITYNSELFASNAIAFKRALRTIGYKHVLIVPDITLQDIVSIRNGRRTMYDDIGDADTEYMQHGNRILIQIVFGIFDPMLLLPHYIVYETEQVCTLMKDNSLLHLHALSRATAVMTFSQYHKEYLQSQGVKDVSVVPFYHMVNDKMIDTDQDCDLGGADDEPTGVLFFGGISERRQSLWPHLVPTMKFSNITHVFFMGGPESFVRDEELDRAVRRSKVVVNFHGCNSSSLAVHRINYLLGMGKCVVSERSSEDAALDAEYEKSGSVVFVDNVVDLFVVAAEYAQDDVRRHAVEVQAKAQYAAIHANVSELKVTMDRSVRSVHVTMR